MKKSSVFIKISLFFACAIVLFSIALGIVIIVRYGDELKGEKEPVTTPVVEQVATPGVTNIPGETLKPTDTPTPTPTDTPTPTRRIMVAVDPGNIKGVTSITTGKSELEWTVTEAKKVGQMLLDRGYDVTLTRRVDEENLSVEDRVNIANAAGADILICLRTDSFEKSGAYGVYFQASNGEDSDGSALSLNYDVNRAKELGTLIMDKVVRATAANKRNDSIKGSGNVLFNGSNMPSVILRLGFMTNEQEDKNLWSDEYQDLMAAAICDGIDAYFEQYPVER